MFKTIFIITFLILILALCIGGYIFIPLNPTGPNITMSFAPNTSLSKMAKQLEKAKIIPSALGLRLWIKILGTEKRIQAGNYVFVEYEGTVSVAEKLLHATGEDVSITIPEGLTLEQIATLYSQSFGIDTTQFLSLCRSADFASQCGISAQSLEGYLYPNSYRFDPLATEMQIIKRMVSGFKKMYKSLPDTSLNAKKYTQHEIITMASIVEKEAALASERERIAGVFFNRLKIGYPLGADPTVRYIYKKFDGPLYVSELNSSSPYNTRKFKGLPPGPICSPGKAAIRASLFPLTTSDLYFVAKWNGSKEHDFSKTYEDHLKKTLAIRRINEKRITTVTKGSMCAIR